MKRYDKDIKSPGIETFFTCFSTIGTLASPNIVRYCFVATAFFWCLESRRLIFPKGSWERSVDRLLRVGRQLRQLQEGCLARRIGVRFGCLNLSLQPLPASIHRFECKQMAISSIFSLFSFLCSGHVIMTLICIYHQKFQE